jgi:hypothetical protein
MVTRSRAGVALAYVANSAVGVPNGKLPIPDLFRASTLLGQIGIGQRWDWSADDNRMLDFPFSKCGCKTQSVRSDKVN